MTRTYNPTTRQERPAVNPRREVSWVFPPLYAHRLVAACGDRSAVDRITEEMAAAGVVRHPKDASRFKATSGA